MDIVLYCGKDMRISKNCTAGEMYVKMKDTYAEGIKTIKTSSEMKEHCKLLSELNSELKQCSESLKKELKSQ